MFSAFVGEYVSDINEITGTDAGTYTVYYKAVNGANYADTDAASISVSIAKATQTVTAPEAATLHYTGEAQKLISKEASTTGDGTVVYSLTGKGDYTSDLSEIVGTTAGTYTVYYKIKDSTNYNDVDAQNISVSIGKATIAAEASEDAGTYLYTQFFTLSVPALGTAEGSEDASANSIEITRKDSPQTAGTASISICLYSEESSSFSETAYTEDSLEAGKYAVKLTLSGDSEINDVQDLQIASFTIYEDSTSADEAITAAISSPAAVNAMCRCRPSAMC